MLFCHTDTLFVKLLKKEVFIVISKSSTSSGTVEQEVLHLVLNQSYTYKYCTYTREMLSLEEMWSS